MATEEANRASPRPYKKPSLLPFPLSVPPPQGRSKPRLHSCRPFRRRAPGALPRLCRIHIPPPSSSSLRVNSPTSSRSFSNKARSQKGQGDAVVFLYVVCFPCFVFFMEPSFFTISASSSSICRVSDRFVLSYGT